LHTNIHHSVSIKRNLSPTAILLTISTEHAWTTTQEHLSLKHSNFIVSRNRHNRAPRTFITSSNDTLHVIWLSFLTEILHPKLKDNFIQLRMSSSTCANSLSWLGHIDHCLSPWFARYHEVGALCSIPRHDLRHVNSTVMNTRLHGYRKANVLLHLQDEWTPDSLLLICSFSYFDPIVSWQRMGCTSAKSIKTNLMLSRISSREHLHW
jgi:hypothetical protein